MTSYVTPKKGFPFICYVGLVSQSTGQFQSNPTLAAGDFKISKDGGALGNLTTLPAVTPASSKSVKIALDSDETDADNLVIIGSDAAGAEWDDIFLNIQTTAKQIDDLATPTNITAGTITTVTNLTNAPTNGDFTATMKTSLNNATPQNTNITAIKAQTDRISFDSDNYTLVDLKAIEGALTSGNNATLNLKKLNIVNIGDDSVNIVSFGGRAIYAGSDNYPALQLISSTDEAVEIQSNETYGIFISGGLSGLYIYSTGDDAVVFETTGTNKDALKLNGSGTGKSISALKDIAVSDGNLTLAAIASAVWANATRTLTSFGTLISDVWGNITRTITGGTIDSNDDKTGYSLISAYDPAKTTSQDSDMFDVLSYVTHLTFDSDDKVFANSAVSLTSDDIQSIVDALSFPTADENAQTLLKYDLSTITGEADRSPINALRKLRNKVSFVGSTLSIKKEDDIANAYTQSVTQDSDQEPFKSVG